MTGKEAIELAIKKTNSAINETEKQVATLQGVLMGYKKQKEQLLQILEKIK